MCRLRSDSVMGLGSGSGSERLTRKAMEMDSEKGLERDLAMGSGLAMDLG